MYTHICACIQSASTVHLHTRAHTLTDLYCEVILHTHIISVCNVALCFFGRAIRTLPSDPSGPTENWSSRTFRREGFTPAADAANTSLMFLRLVDIMSGVCPEKIHTYFKRMSYTSLYVYNVYKYIYIYIYMII